MGKGKGGIKGFERVVTRPGSTQGDPWLALTLTHLTPRLEGANLGGIRF